MLLYFDYAMTKEIQMISYEIPTMIYHFNFSSDVKRYKSYSTWKTRMITHRMSVTFFLFGVVYLLSVKVTNGQQTDSTGNIHCTMLRFLSFLINEFSSYNIVQKVT